MRSCNSTISHVYKNHGTIIVTKQVFITILRKGNVALVHWRSVWMGYSSAADSRLECDKSKTIPSNPRKNRERLLFIRTDISVSLR